MTMMTVGIGVAVFVLIGVSAVWWAIFAETEEQEEEITLRNDREEDRMALEQALRAEGSAREELRTLRNELVSSRASHEATKKEADKIIGQLKEAEAKVKDLEAKAKIRIEEFEREASALRFETEQYKSKMVEALERGKTLEEKCADAQQLMSQLQEAQEVNQNLRNEKRDLQAKYQKEIEGFKELEKINFQSKVQQSNDINFQEAESAKKINQQFSEQNKFVQVELVKARARAQGLERICTDYQAQIEELLKKAHGAVRGVS